VPGSTAQQALRDRLLRYRQRHRGSRHKAGMTIEPIAANDPLSVDRVADALAADLLFVQLAPMKTLRLCCFATLGLSACGMQPQCSSEVLQVARDLGSDRYAATSARNCGATTDYATVVHVGRSSEPQSSASEVFVADSDHGAATDGLQGAIWMNVVWTAPGKLSVAYASKARIFKRLPDAKGASISYKASDPLSLPAAP
jgi:hypothetical protein